jgi:type II secretory pathway pseudopilin PulG
MLFSPFIVPVVAIVCGIGAGIFRTWIRFKERQLELASTQAAEKAAQYAAKTERLEQRVAVLERIITDRSAHLADEIERLRDQPLN